MAYVDAASINRKTVLYVGGLEESVTEKTLEAAFLPFGDLMQIIMPKDATTSQHSTAQHSTAQQSTAQQPPAPLLPPSLTHCVSAARRGSPRLRLC